VVSFFLDVDEEEREAETVTSGRVFLEPLGRPRLRGAGVSSAAATGAAAAVERAGAAVTADFVAAGARSTCLTGLALMAARSAAERLVHLLQMIQPASVGGMEDPERL
jgi:hypothetical protein